MAARESQMAAEEVKWQHGKSNGTQMAARQVNWQHGKVKWLGGWVLGGVLEGFPTLISFDLFQFVSVS